MTDDKATTIICANVSKRERKWILGFAYILALIKHFGVI